MNRKGFTLLELLTTFVILGAIILVSVRSISSIFNITKDKSEDTFVETIKDAMDMYLTSSNAKGLNYSIQCTNTLEKSYNPSVKVYRVNTNFKAVIDSEFKPIMQSDLVNPANEDVACNSANNIDITIYRDEDFVYYYSVNKSEFGCLKGTGLISNLPEGFVC